MQNQLQKQYKNEKDIKGSSKTALELSMDSEQKEALAHFVCETYSTYSTSMGSWKTKLKRYEDRMDDDFKDRLHNHDRDYDDKAIPNTIFNLQNDTLNVVGGFAEFAFAQAKNDILGTNPFMTVSAEGINDEALAETLTKHSIWKGSKTNQKSCIAEALLISVNLGTSFPKVTWERRQEEYERMANVLVDSSTKKPVLTSNGDYVYDDDAIIETSPKDQGIIKKAVNALSGNQSRYPAKDETLDLSKGSYTYQQMLVKEVITTHNNADFSNINFRDICFDITAPHLDLQHTAVFHQYKCPILDAKYDYQLSDEEYSDLEGQIHQGGSVSGTETSMGRDPRIDDDESSPSPITGNEITQGNPLIRLVEGYIRVDPFGGNKPVRIYVVFCPETQTILKVDYLANVTPSGRLPIFAIPTYRRPGRIIGRGFLEKFEKVQDSIDANYNAITWHNRINSNPFTAYNPNSIEGSIDEDNPLTPSLENPYELKDGQTIQDFVQFLSLPDLDNRTMDLINLMVEVAQLRTGITSATRGELSSGPQNDTAAAVRSLSSRAATLLKWVIDDLRDATTPVLSYWIDLLYSNHSEEDVFKWGEGDEAELITLTPDEVKDLKYNVKVLMVQSQAQEKLEMAQTAMGIHGQWIQLPEHEKNASRPLYIKALKSVGFDDAEDIIRKGIVDVEQLVAILPPEMQQLFIQFIQSQQQQPTDEEGARPDQERQDVSVAEEQQQEV